MSKFIFLDDDVLLNLNLVERLRRYYDPSEDEYKYKIEFISQTSVDGKKTFSMSFKLRKERDEKFEEIKKIVGVEKSCQCEEDPLQCQSVLKITPGEFLTKKFEREINQLIQNLESIKSLAWCASSAPQGSRIAHKEISKLAEIGLQAIRKMVSNHD